jgi:phosphomannomutase/phosphoglucomutase
VKGFTRNAKSPIAAPDNSQACANKTSFALVRPGFLLGVAGLLVAAALTWASQSEQPSQPYLDAISQTAAAATAASFERASAQLETRTATAAQGAAVIDAVQRQDPTALRAAEAQLKSWGRALDVQINLRKQGQIDDNRPAPMNYAGLDMLNQAEVGTAPPLEAHKVGQRWIVYSVAPIRAVAGQQVLGTLLIAVDLQQLLDPLIENLPKPGDPQQLGEFRLSQRFGEEPAQVLFQSGIASSGTRYPIASGSRNWTLEFTPGPGSQYQTPWLSLGMAVVALLLAIAALWAGLTLTCRRLRAQVEADARQLSQLLQELSGGKAVKSFSLSLPELNGLAQSLARFSLRDKPAPVGKKPTAPPDTPAPAWLDPTFQNSDILDIDILEPDDIGPEPAIAAPASDLPPALPLSIFRAYDIRGVVGTSLTAETAYWIGRAVGAQSLALDEANVCVGRDGRLSGPMLVQQLIQGLHDSGCHVTDVGLVPTPALYYAAHVLEGKSAVMLTGSHNPADYNGFKIVIAGDTLANDQILALHTRIRINALPKGQGSVSQVDILPRYFETIAKDIVVARRLKVVVDCGNGAAGVIAPQLIEALGCDVIALFCEVDGNFPNHHPDPGKPENLADLIAKVRETGADIGLAFDGDGDRVGVVTNAGTIIYPDRLLMLFAKDVLARNPGADIIFDVKCTRRLTPLIKEHGGRPVMWKTGHSLIKKQMKISGALLAGEMSGHIFFKERWYGFDDGLYSAARLLEILSQDKSSAEELFAAFPDDISTPEINIDVTDEGKFSIIDALQRDAQWGEANLTTLDGVRVDYPRGWGLVRASNTTPVLVLRFEAEDQAELERIQDVFRLQLHHVAPDLKLPF